MITLTISQFFTSRYGRPVPILFSRASVVVFLLISTTSVANASGCQEAQKMFQSAEQMHRSGNVDSENVLRSNLEKLLKICPNHLKGINLLAAVEEKAGNYDRAEELYYRIQEEDYSALYSYAGLGDVHVAQGRHKEAAEDYQLFLKLLGKELKSGKQSPYAKYVSVYRKKMEEAIVNSRQSGVVSANEITQSLLASNNTRQRSRAIVLYDEQAGDAAGEPPADLVAKASIDLNILFNSNSDRLHKDSMHQIQEIATSLMSEELSEVNIRIEGHTDSLGSEQYNHQLSLRRSLAVRDLLVKSGVPKNRLEVVGKGEAEPVMTNDTKMGRTLNRRVTLVNIN
ncbi:MAG: OmpA family protein [Magnetococcales bacterium]|nr:OmpA family protein [Magnetococcales bacterium]